MRDDFLLSSERAALGPLRREHVPLLAPWFNDPEVRRGLAHRGLLNEDSERRWFEDVTDAARAPRPSGIVFAVYDRSDASLVGIIGLEDIDWAFGRCGFGIFLGRRRGVGIGTEATRLALTWAFRIMGLRNVLLETYDFNAPARRAYLAAGFREIGRRRDAVVVLGERRDVILMDAIPDDVDLSALAGLPGQSESGG